MTVSLDGAKITSPNLIDPLSGGFVLKSKKLWTKPTIRQWHSADEVREHFKTKGTSAERAALDSTLALSERLRTKADYPAPIKRRA